MNALLVVLPTAQVVVGQAKIRHLGMTYQAERLLLTVLVAVLMMMLICSAYPVAAHQGGARLQSVTGQVVLLLKCCMLLTVVQSGCAGLTKQQDADQPMEHNQHGDANGSRLGQGQEVEVEVVR